MKCSYSQLIFISILTWGQYSQSEDQASIHGLGEVEIASNWYLDLDEAYADANQKLCELLRHRAGLDSQNSPTLKRLWAQSRDQIIDNSHQRIETRSRVYGDIFRVVISGTISHNAIRNYQKLYENEIQKFWWKWVTTLAVVLGGVIVGLNLTIRLDRASYGDHRSILCAVCAASVTCVDSAILCGVWSL